MKRGKRPQYILCIIFNIYHDEGNIQVGSNFLLQVNRHLELQETIQLLELDKLYSIYLVCSVVDRSPNRDSVAAVLFGSVLSGNTIEIDTNGRGYPLLSFSIVYQIWFSK